MSLINRKLQKKNPIHVRCQKCLEDGHWSYQCKNNRKTKLRPSRTQILNNFVKQMEQTKSQSNGKGKLTNKKAEKGYSTDGSSTSDSSSDSSDSSGTSDSDDSSDSSDSSDFSDSTDSSNGKKTKCNDKKLKSSVKKNMSNAGKRCSGGQCSLPAKKKRKGKESSSDSSESDSSS